MTTFYALPNDGLFWHWPTLLHFTLVALAGGAAVILGLLSIRRAKHLRGYALLTAILIVLDLFVLWAESPARFRFTHLYLFLSVRPGAAMWWGGWGLAGSLVLSVPLALRWGPRRLWGSLLLATGGIALLYPGFLLVANSNRPLWTPLLLAFIPVTSLALAAAVPLLARWRWVRGWAAAASATGALLGGLYLLGLAVGGADAREALAHFWHDAGLWFLVGLALMAGAAALARRVPMLAGLAMAAGAILARSLIVEIGQAQPFS